MAFALTTTTPFAGVLISDEGTDHQVELHYVKMFELDKGSYFGELIYDKDTYPNAEFTMYWGDDDINFRIDGTSVYLKSNNHYYKAGDTGPTIEETKENSTGIGNFPDQISFKVTNGPMHSWFLNPASSNPGVGTHNFDASDFTNENHFIPAGNNPALTLVDFTGSALEMGAILGTLNYGFPSQYTGCLLYTSPSPRD